jgi:hypothetical protein
MAGIKQVTDKFYHISWSKYTSSQAKVKLMTLAVIDTDCIGRGKSTVWSLPQQAFHIENFIIMRYTYIEENKIYDLTWNTKTTGK